jgi:hypothetical protein
LVCGKLEFRCSNQWVVPMRMAPGTPRRSGEKAPKRIAEIRRKFRGLKTEVFCIDDIQTRIGAAIESAESGNYLAAVAIVWDLIRQSRESPLGVRLPLIELMILMADNLRFHAGIPYLLESSQASDFMDPAGKIDDPFPSILMRANIAQERMGARATADAFFRLRSLESEYIDGHADGIVGLSVRALASHFADQPSQVSSVPLSRAVRT